MPQRRPTETGQREQARRARSTQRGKQRGSGGAEREMPPLQSPRSGLGRRQSRQRSGLGVNVCPASRGGWPASQRRQSTSPPRPRCGADAASMNTAPSCTGLGFNTESGRPRRPTRPGAPRVSDCGGASASAYPVVEPHVSVFQFSHGTAGATLRRRRPAWTYHVRRRQPRVSRLVTVASDSLGHGSRLGLAYSCRRRERITALGVSHNTCRPWILMSSKLTLITCHCRAAL